MTPEAPLPVLATVRRFEAAGFRAWPAASAHYDGAWLMRLTPGHPAKRLNSINPLDPGDHFDISSRIEKARSSFAEIDQPLTFRLSPLAGDKITAYLDAQGWQAFDESLVMHCDLEGSVVEHALDQIPLKDVERFTQSLLSINEMPRSLTAALGGVIQAVPAEAGLFVLESDAKAVAATVCVHDGDLAGLFEVATAPSERGKGFGRRIVTSALKWALGRGARQAWLQVGAENEPAVNLYRSLGFSELYRYHYRRPPTP